MDKEFSNIRIVDIAKMAGVSVGTVDRVIHNRGRVSEENRKKVQTILEMVHYQPNLMARSLASKKQYHFVSTTPSFTHGEYWEAISEGIDKAASEMESYNITITKLFFDQYNNKTLMILSAICWMKSRWGIDCNAVYRFCYTAFTRA